MNDADYPCAYCGIRPAIAGLQTAECSRCYVAHDRAYKRFVWIMVAVGPLISFVLGFVVGAMSS